MAEVTREAPVIETVVGRGVVVSENDPGPLTSAGVHALCSSLAARGIPTVLLTARRRPLPDLEGTYVTDSRLRAIEDHVLPVRLALQIWNLLVLLRVLRTSGSNVVVRQVRRPHRFDLTVIRVLHLMHRRVVFAPRFLSVGRRSETDLPRFAKKIYKKVDAIVLRTHADENMLRIVEPDVGGRTRVVPVGEMGFVASANLPDPTEARRRLGFSQRQALVLCVADEIDGASAVDFVEAVTSLRGSVQAILTGRGVDAQFPALARRLAEAGLEETLELVPSVEFASDPGVYFAAADVTVIPNRRVPDQELAYYSVAHNRPVVVTDVGGFAEILDEGIPGGMARPGDAQSIAAAIEQAVFPRRRLQQQHWELETRPPKLRSWNDVSADFVPLLDLQGTRTGRRMAPKSLKIWLGILYMFVLLLTMMIVGANAKKGFSAFNVGLVLGIMLPAATLFLLLVPFDVKFLLYWVVLFFFDVPARAFPKLPLQYIPSLVVAAMIFHLIIESPPDRVQLKGTRFLHALLLMQVGWALAEMFNPNMSDWGSTVKMIRLILEPLLVYVCALAYFRSSLNIRRFVNVYVVIGGLAAFYGVKIAFVGYFGFEQEVLKGSMIESESRNIGTMGNPQVWGMWMMHVALFGFALLLEKSAWRQKWWLWLIIPCAVLGVITSGARIQFIGLGLGVPLILALSIGNPATRMRATVSLFLVAAAGLFIWFWIPDEGTSRAELKGNDPITSARAKLGTLKDPESDDEVLEQRLNNGSNTLEAVIAHPLGGGLGLTYVAKIEDPLTQGNPTQVIGQTDVQATRARNQVPMQIGDFFFINWMAEQGVVGVILIALIFALMVLWNLWVATQARNPLHRALCATGFVWGIAYIINSNTNDAFFSPVSSSGFLAFLALAVCVLAVEEKEYGPVETPARVSLRR